MIIHIKIFFKSTIFYTTYNFLKLYYYYQIFYLKLKNFIKIQIQFFELNTIND